MNKLSIKQNNRSSVLSLILSNQSISRKNVAATLGISPAAVSNLVDELIRDGLVIEGPAGESTSRGGRRPISLKINGEAGRILSVVIRLQNPQVAVCDLLGNLIDYRTYPEQEFDSTDQLMQVLFADIDRLVRDAGGSSLFIGAGCSIPGIVENNIIQNSPELGLAGSSLAERLEQMLGFPVYLDKDVYMNALGENWMGAGRLYSNFVTVTVGAGIGSAIIIDNQVYRGTCGMAGEIGYLCTSGDAFTQGPFSYTDFGYFERYASVNILRESMGIHFHQIARQAKEGDEALRQKILEQTDHLCLGLSSLISLINPEAVILTGTYKLVSDLVLERIRKNLEYLTPIRCEVTFSQLGNRMLAYGCVGTVLQKQYGITFLQHHAETKEENKNG